jgi:two-component system sensor histidine kinase RegB
LRPVFVWAITGLTISAFGILLVQPFSFLSSENTAEMQHHAHGNAHAEMHSDNNDAFGSHLLGMWLAYSITSIFSAYFVTSLGAQLKKVIEDREVLKQGQLRLNSMVRLAAGAAHELSTPLNTIRLILDDLPNEDGELDIIKSQTIRCTEIIKRLNPAELDSTNLDLEEIDISDLFDSIINENQLLDSSSNIISIIPTGRIKYSLPKKSIILILKNLISNAAYANKQSDINNINTDKTIKLSFNDLKDKIEFIVQDSGSGFDPVVLNKIGEPFITTKKTGSGLGLGLFIIDLTVKRFGGSLVIESKQGLGSVVKVVFSYPIKLQTL